MDNFVDRVHTCWTGAGSRGLVWTDGGTDRRHWSAKVCSPEHGLWHLQSTEAHRQGHNRERGARATRLGPHWAQAAAWRPGDSGEMVEGRELTNSGTQASEEGEE
jgi:hypothetical protein